MFRRAGKMGGNLLRSVQTGRHARSPQICAVPCLLRLWMLRGKRHAGAVDRSVIAKQSSGGRKLMPCGRLVDQEHAALVR